jgi:hypothetical protein
VPAVKLREHLLIAHAYEAAEREKVNGDHP